MILRVTRMMRERRGRGEGRASCSCSSSVPAEATSVSASISAVVEAEASEAADPAVVQESKPKHTKVKRTNRARGRTKPKDLRRECSRPEV